MVKTRDDLNPKKFFLFKKNVAVDAADFDTLQNISSCPDQSPELFLIFEEKIVNE